MITGDNLLSTYHFLVTIGQEIFGFSKISNLESAIEYETVSEGGNNAYPLLFPKQKTKPDTLILEKGIMDRSSGSFFESLTEGTHLEMVIILVTKGDDQLEKAFFFKEGIITKRSFSDLDAMKCELFIEKMEITHSGLVEIPLPDSINTLSSLY